MDLPHSASADIQCQGMNPRDQIGAKGGMDRPMALHAVHRAECGVTNCHTEMRLPGAIITRMACVAVAVIDHIQLLGAESSVQLRINFLCNRHMSVNPLQSHDQ